MNKIYRDPNQLWQSKKEIKNNVVLNQNISPLLISLTFDEPKHIDVYLKREPINNNELALNNCLFICKWKAGDTEENSQYSEGIHHFYTRSLKIWGKAISTIAYCTAYAQAVLSNSSNGFSIKSEHQSYFSNKYGYKNYEFLQQPINAVYDYKYLMPVRSNKNGSLIVEPEQTKILLDTTKTITSNGSNICETGDLETNYTGLLNYEMRFKINAGLLKYTYIFTTKAGLQSTNYIQKDFSSVTYAGLLKGLRPQLFYSASYAGTIQPAFFADKLKFRFRFDTAGDYSIIYNIIIYKA